VALSHVFSVGFNTGRNSSYIVTNYVLPEHPVQETATRGRDLGYTFGKTHYIPVFPTHIANLYATVGVFGGISYGGSSVVFRYLNGSGNVSSETKVGS